MSTNRLQLTLIPEPRHRAQPLPPEIRAASVELIARMLLQVVRPESASSDVKERRDESR